MSEEQAKEFEKVVDLPRIEKYILELQKENKELKLQLKGTTFCYDEEEHQRLLEENKELKGLLEQAKHNEKQASNSCRQHRLASKNHLRRIKRREKQRDRYITILNELESWLEEEKLKSTPNIVWFDKEKYEEVDNPEGFKPLPRCVVIKEILDKLKELKESDE